jgi:hypothetical protein
MSTDKRQAATPCCGAAYVVQHLGGINVCQPCGKRIVKCEHCGELNAIPQCDAPDKHNCTVCQQGIVKYEPRRSRR